MASATLVSEDIASGERFLQELQTRVPVKSAFWQFTTEGFDWTLCVASDRFVSGNALWAFDTAFRAADALPGDGFDTLRLMVLNGDDPRAIGAAEVAARAIGRRGIWMRDNSFGMYHFAEAYVYSPAIVNPAPATAPSSA